MEEDYIEKDEEEFMIKSIFEKDRDEAFASGDKNKIIEYCRKYKIEIPKDDKVFWTGVHKGICKLYLNGNPSIAKTQYDKSYEWLAKHKYSPSTIL